MNISKQAIEACRLAYNKHSISPRIRYMVRKIIR
uniref:Uncharacterized protein n=1 Tax=Rhizophora mucronata TaxID=61149 RepID=A0A2P2KDH1_RHIMU